MCKHKHTHKNTTNFEDTYVKDGRSTQATIPNNPLLMKACKRYYMNTANLYPVQTYSGASLIQAIWFPTLSISQKKNLSLKVYTIDPCYLAFIYPEPRLSIILY